MSPGQAAQAAPGTPVRSPPASGPLLRVLPPRERGLEGQAENRGGDRWAGLWSRRLGQGLIDPGAAEKGFGGWAGGSLWSVEFKQRHLMPLGEPGASPGQLDSVRAAWAPECGAGRPALQAWGCGPPPHPPAPPPRTHMHTHVYTLLPCTGHAQPVSNRGDA